MGRVRASTTVDSERLRRCRELLGVPDSEVIDAALRTLHDRLVARAELEALEALPYEDDPELAWEASAGPDLPHDGEIPDDVLELARQRRSRPWITTPQPPSCT